MTQTLTLQDWILRLRPGETPVFRHTRETLLALSRKGDSLSSKELAQPILADPLATLRILYAANNRSTRHVGSEIASVEHALLMQGVVPFLGKVASLPVLETTPAARNPVALATLYRQLRLAQHAAWQARDFAVLQADTRAEEAQVTALLYYAPEFLFWLQAPETAAELARLRRRMPTAEAEEQALGFQLPALRQSMLEAWKIPDAIRDLLDDDLAGRPRQILLRACLDIAHRSRHGWWDEGLGEDYQALAGLVKWPLDDVTTTVHTNAVRVARAGAWVPATPAAAWLVMEPGEWPSEPDEEEAALPRPAAVPTPPQAAPAKPQPTPQASQPRSPPAEPPADVKAGPAAAPAPVLAVARRQPQVTGNPKIFADSIAAIEEHLDGSLDLNQMSALILKGLHGGLDLSRIMFAMVTPDGLRVKCRFTLGIQADDPLRHFEFPFAQQGLFGRLMTKMQGVWINADNRAKFSPMVGPDLQNVIGQGDFYAMSLFAGSKPLGLVYADRGHDEIGLDTQTYADFKQLCLQASRGLAKVKT